MAAGGSGNQQGKRGGYSGPERRSDGPPHAGRGGGAVAGLGNPGGGFNRNSPANNGAFAGLGGLNARRTQNISPSYELSPHNVAVVGNMLAPGGTLRKAAGIGPTEFRGFTGNRFGPGDYDPRNASAMQRADGGMRRFMPNPLTMNRARAAALGGPAPQPSAPVGPMPWWRTPFPGVR